MTQYDKFEAEMRGAAPDMVTGALSWYDLTLTLYRSGSPLTTKLMISAMLHAMYAWPVPSDGPGWPFATVKAMLG